MGNYKLSAEAQEDLIRIHQFGVRKFGEQKADQYFFAFYERFDQLLEQPFMYPAADDIRRGYRMSVCGVDSIYFCVNGDNIEIMAILGRQDTIDRL